MSQTRRTLLAAMPAVLAGVRQARSQGGTPARAEVPWSSGTEAPTRPLPADAADCHHHVYDKRFPVAPGVSATPPDATASDYAKLQARLGITRHVAVQPSAYGTDNACLLDALGRFGTSARGVAVVDTMVSDAELKKLDAAGVRGIRFNFAPAGATTPEMIVPLARRVADLGWHVQLHAGADQILAMDAMLTTLPCPLVIDHLGHVPQPVGVGHPVYAFLRRRIDAGRTWVKLSAVYADTKVGPPTYEDVGRVEKALLSAAPQRLVWGTDWPHPSEPADRKPDDAKLADLFAEWAGDERTRTTVLVRNPVELYHF